MFVPSDVCSSSDGTALSQLRVERRETKRASRNPGTRWTNTAKNPEAVALNSLRWPSVGADTIFQSDPRVRFIHVAPPGAEIGPCLRQYRFRTHFATKRNATRTKNATVCIRWSYPADVTTHQKRVRPVKSHGAIVGDGEVGRSIGLHGHNLCSLGTPISASRYAKMT